MEALAHSLEQAHRDAHRASLEGNGLDEAVQWDGLLQAMEHLQQWLAAPGPWRRRPVPQAGVEPASAP